MNFVQMKCPNCGADLEVENDIDSFYCKYCGTKIVIEDQDPEVLKTKRRIKLMDKAHEMQKEYYNDRERREEENRKNSWTAMKMLVIWFAIMLLYMFLKKQGIL